MKNYVIEIVFLLIVVLYAFVHHKIIRNDIARKRTRGIKHFFWALLYSGLMFIVYWKFSKSIPLQFCIASMHMTIFNPLLNKLNNNPFFHLGTRSIIDRMIDKIYRPLYLIIWIIFIILQFYI